VIVGNIATPEAHCSLLKTVPMVKVGVDLVQFVPRIVAGVGFPQFSAVLEVAAALKGLEFQ
jgi:IMP dehydrogenase